MKSLSTILAAALVAGSCTVAMAQAGGGAAGGDQTQQGTMKDADKNPTGAAANPTAGNTAAPMAGQGAPMAGQGAKSGQSGMTTAPASNTRSDNPARPAGTKDATGGSTGGGAVK